jgi:diguanylate cyclase (GGDEF)-like protein/PAS domain S-box-containing protein
VAAALRVLVIEDRESDFRLIERHLRQHRLPAECVRVAGLDELVDMLVRGSVDVVLTDYHVPGLELKDSLAQVQALSPGLPVILVSGQIGEEAAVELLKQGVWDVVLKDRLARLVPAIERGLHEVCQQTSRRFAEEQMRLAAVAFENTLEGIMVADADHRIMSVNRAFSEITGHATSQIVGKDLSVLGADRHDGGAYGRMWACLHANGSWNGEVWNRRCDGDTYPAWFNMVSVRDQNGKITHYVGVLTDISERKAAQARIEHLAHHDALTDLPNRSLLADRMQQAIAQAQRGERPVAVLFVDIDHFKHINDSLGHAIGDRVLVEVSRRIVSNVRSSDTVARLSGDEFVVLLPEAGGVEGVVRVVAGISAAIADLLQIEGHRLRMSASIGVSLFPKDGREAATLLTNADLAMYHAKSAGRSTYRFFSPEMDVQARERFRIDSDLRDALARREFSVYYQPQVESRTSLVTGYEALVRWHHPERGLLSPDAFLRVAEETGLIVSIGDWVLRQACAQCVSWRKRGYRGSISVNLSARQFGQDNLLERVKECLHDSGLPGNSLVLELTESLLVEPTAASMKLLHDLRGLGVQIAVDDFGQGYSSLSYLKRYPITSLKIAQSFVDEIVSESEDRAIVQAVVTLASAMRLQTVAEGVEHDAQAYVLRDMGVDALQGYYFGRAMPASEVKLMCDLTSAA